MIYWFHAPLIFANVDSAIDEIEALVQGADPPASALLISADAITDIDVTALDALSGFFADLRESGIAVGVARMKADVSHQLERADALDCLGDAILLEVDAAVDAFRAGTFGGR